MTATTVGAYDRLIDVLENVKHPSGNQDKARANCPAHDSASRSSLSIKRAEGKALVYCFGGCTVEQILDALGWSKADLYDDRRGYDYAYSDGAFSHRRYNGDGKKKFWQTGNTSGDSTPLYRLSRVEVAKLAGQEVWLVEGEDDVHALETLGVRATTTRGGVGMMGKADLSPLYGARINAVVDKDGAGARWAQYMRTMLEGKARSLAFVQAKTGKDAADHIAADHELDDFEPYEFPAEDAPEPVRRIRLTPASSIKPRPVRWAWTDRIPAGELTLTPGRGGLGKSTFHAWMIAHLTRGTLDGVHFGTPWPCIIAASEDSWERTVVPRLLAIGADLDLVHRVDVITETDEEVSISLPRDVVGLTEEIIRIGAALLSVDPVMSALSSGLDTHKDREVRLGIEPLARLADRTGCVVLGNAHFNKSAGPDPLSLIMGSAAFGNVARAALGFARDTEDEDGACVVSQVKNNLGRLDLPSLRYRIDSATIDTEEGPAEVGKLVMLGESHRSVADILSDRDAGGRDDSDDQSEVEVWLAEFLSGGPVAANDVYRAADAHGYSKDKAKRAKKKLGVLATHPDIKGPWFWEVPQGSNKESKGAPLPNTAPLPLLDAPLEADSAPVHSDPESAPSADPLISPERSRNPYPQDPQNPRTGSHPPAANPGTAEPTTPEPEADQHCQALTWRVCPDRNCHVFGGCVLGHGGDRDA